MRFWISVIFAVIVITGMWTFLYTSNPDLRRRTPVVETQDPAPNPNLKLPKVVVDTTQKTISNLPQAYHGESKFELTNAGEATLQMHPYSPSCTCAALELIKETPQGKQSIKMEADDKRKWTTTRTPESLGLISLEPNEKATLIVFYDTRDRLGQYQVSAGIQTNDPLKDRLAVTLNLEVKQDIIMAPPAVNFGPISEGKKSEATMLVYSTIHDKFELLEPKTTNPAILVSAVPATKEELDKVSGKAGYKVKMITEGALALGPFVEKLGYKTSIPRARELTAEITGAVIGKMEVYPPKVKMGIVAVRTPHERKVQVFANGLKESEVLKIGDISPGFVQAEIARNNAGKNVWIINIHIKSDAPPGPFSGSIAIVDQSGTKRLNVPVEGVVSGEVKASGG